MGRRCRGWRATWRTITPSRRVGVRAVPRKTGRDVRAPGRGAPASKLARPGIPASDDVRTARGGVPSTPVKQVEVGCTCAGGRSRRDGRCARAQRHACDFKISVCWTWGQTSSRHTQRSTKTCIRALAGTDAFLPATRSMDLLILGDVGGCFGQCRSSRCFVHQYQHNGCTPACRIGSCQPGWGTWGLCGSSDHAV